MKRNTILLCFMIALAAFGASAFTQSKAKLFKKSIEVDKATEIRTDIYFFSGKLDINTSTDKLAECFYGYEDGFQRPVMTYSEVGKTGYLAIKSDDNDKDIDIDQDDNKWNLSLNKNIINEIAIKLKAGEANINLEGSRLQYFDYKMTAGESHINLRNTSVPKVRFNLLAGEAKIDLSGKWHNDCFAEIKGGVGEITVTVPYDTGVRIYVSGMLGEVNIPFFHREGNTYTNDCFGKTKNVLNINLSGGIGQINVKMEE